MPIVDQDIELRRLILDSKKIAVVGITKNPKKPGYYVPKALKEKGFQVYGVNPKYAGQQIDGIEVYLSLREIPDEIDVVLVIRPPTEVPEIAKEAYLKGFKTFWMQPGTLNEDVKNELIEKGYNVVAERCMKVESDKYL